MIWIVLGVLLWAGAHAFRRLAPKARKGMGDAGRGMVAAASLIAIALMVIGYRIAEPVTLWTLPAGVTWLSVALMVVAVFLFGLGKSKSRLNGAMRHPMLTAVILWAVAHLLVAGNSEALVLFGGMGLWAAAEIILINRAQPRWTPPPRGNAKGDLRWLVISAVAFVVIVGAHVLIGPSPLARIVT